MKGQKVLAVVLTAMVSIAGAGLITAGFMESRRLERKIEVLSEEVDDLISEKTLLEQSITEVREKKNTYEEQLREEQEERNRRQAEEEKVAEVEQIAGLKPGEVLPFESYSDIPNIDDYFYGNDIAVGDEIYQRINQKSYHENENVLLEDLTYLKLLHYNFDHRIQVGEMIVNRAIKEDVLNIFKELFQAEYEIQSIYLIDNYWVGDPTETDNESIQYNNTSAFCYREATNSSTLSDHAYGRAIDINPQQNPYVTVNADGSQTCHHENARIYLDRSMGDPHMVLQGDLCYQIFEKYGFQWGGNWSNPIDYQHFYKKP